MWSPDEYARQAKAVADAFCAAQGALGGNDLTTLVEKVTRDHGLNPEQIRRLGRDTNTAVFGHKYAAKRGEADRRVDFDPVDPEVVITRLQATAAPTPAIKQASYPDLPNPRAWVRAKTAAETIDPYLPKTPPAVPRWSHLQKLSQELPLNLRQLDVRWQSNLRALAEDCRADGHDHVTFEKNAIAVLDEDLLPELNGVRELLRLAPLAVSQEKLAEAREFLVGVPTRATRLLKQARDARHEYAKVLATLSEVERALPRAREEALRAR